MNFALLAHLQSLVSGNPYQLLSNGSSGNGGMQAAEQAGTAASVPRIQLLSNNVDNVNYYDDNQQVRAVRNCVWL